MKKPTISIGIPAYNEELNIKPLLLVLLNQKIKYGILKEIIVVSDSSSDKTVTEARSIKNSKIKVVDRKKRLGLNKTQNEILSLSSGDYLVLLDADVLPVGEEFLEEIIKPMILNKKIGLVGADLLSIEPETFFEKIISDSHAFKYSFYKKINKGNNIYVCHGRASAFSKEFYSKIKWPQYPAEDSYAYLYCLNNGFKFKFNSKAKIYFRSPANFADHLKQSKRFFGEQRSMEKYFPKEFVKKHYKIPKFVLLNSTLDWLFKSPISFSMYLGIALYIKFFASLNFQETSSWEPSVTTKKVIDE